MGKLSLSNPILIVDDDPSIASFLKLYFQALGCEVSIATDGHQALMQLDKEEPSFIILDIMMPFMDGFMTCEEIRKRSNAPIIMLTARIAEDDKIRGLQVGADDYLVKPFSPRELTARMQAISRRIKKYQEPISYSNLSYDPMRHRFTWKGKQVHLTIQEGIIVKALLESDGKVCTREYLLNVLYPIGDKSVTVRIVDVHIGNIRQKFRLIDSDFDLIETLRGIGYKLRE